ncbi:MAG: DUF3800 domain-containing protein [Spirochaetaceae bacterium]|nr:DUF3800 domain-containing protein [Spirochaetaceae bacterium]
MAWFLFIDESGHDRSTSPYEVLAGVAIQDRAVREVIDQLHTAEIGSFGRRYSDGARELKGKVLLKKKVFRHRALTVEVDAADVPALARAALDDGAQADARMLKALAIAKLNYVASVFDICAQLGCRAFASIVETDARRTASGGLRKDYAYLFERFFSRTKSPVCATVPLGSGSATLNSRSGASRTSPTCGHRPNAEQGCVEQRQ